MLYTMKVFQLGVKAILEQVPHFGQIPNARVYLIDINPTMSSEGACGKCVCVCVWRRVACVGVCTCVCMCVLYVYNIYIYICT